MTLLEFAEAMRARGFSVKVTRLPKRRDTLFDLITKHWPPKQHTRARAIVEAIDSVLLTEMTEVKEIREPEPLRDLREHAMRFTPAHVVPTALLALSALLQIRADRARAYADNTMIPVKALPERYRKWVEEDMPGAMALNVTALRALVERRRERFGEPVRHPIFLPNKPDDKRYDRVERGDWPDMFMGFPVKFVSAEELAKAQEEPPSDRVFRQQMVNHEPPPAYVLPHCMTGAGSHESPTCHKHKCAACGAVWIHSNHLSGLSHRIWLRYHTCFCGDRSHTTRRGYDGPDEPTISHFPLPTAKDFDE